MPSICLTLLHNWIICNPSTQKLNLVGEIYEYIKKYTYSILTKTFDSKNGKNKWYIGGLKKAENMETLGFLWQWMKAALLFLKQISLHFGIFVFKWMLTFLSLNQSTYLTNAPTSRVRYLYVSGWEVQDQSGKE